MGGDNTVINSAAENKEETVKVSTNGDGLTEKIRNFIRLNYNPVQDASQATLRLTTFEIYANITKFYPAFSFTQDQLATWLHELGFTFWDAGGMRFEWLLSSAD